MRIFEMPGRPLDPGVAKNLRRLFSQQRDPRDTMLVAEEIRKIIEQAGLQTTAFTINWKGGKLDGPQSFEILYGTKVVAATPIFSKKDGKYFIYFVCLGRALPEMGVRRGSNWWKWYKHAGPRGYDRIWKICNLPP